MKKNYTKIVIILDKSGSMGSVKDDIISGYNDFIKSQKAVEGKADISLIQFDTTYKFVYNDTPIGYVKDLDNETYRVGGFTALLDAIGRGISETGITLSLMKESDRPEKVLFVIITDGQENASKEYNKTTIANMIKHQQDKYNWTFVFIGANQDAIAVANDYNFGVGNALNYESTSKGTRSMFDKLNVSTCSYRSSANTSNIGYFDNK